MLFIPRLVCCILLWVILSPVFAVLALIDGITTVYGWIAVARRHKFRRTMIAQGMSDEQIDEIEKLFDEVVMEKQKEWEAEYRATGRLPE